jgi:hypothetical protein
MANIAKAVVSKGLRQAGNVLREEAGVLEVRNVLIALASCVDGIGTRLK